MSTTIVPVIIPVKPAQCPHCKANENIKRVCASCNYEYPEPKGGDLWFVPLMIFVICFLFWFIFCVLHWIVTPDLTLVQSFINGYHFVADGLSSLMKRIY